MDEVKKVYTEYTRINKGCRHACLFGLQEQPIEEGTPSIQLQILNLNFFLSFLCCFVDIFRLKRRRSGIEFMTKADHQRRNYHDLALCVWVMESGERVSVRVGVLHCLSDNGARFFCEHNSPLVSLHKPVTP
jgi:hypothetical protein